MPRKRTNGSAPPTRLLGQAGPLPGEAAGRKRLAPNRLGREETAAREVRTYRRRQIPFAGHFVRPDSGRPLSSLLNGGGSAVSRRHGRGRPATGASRSSSSPRCAGLPASCRNRRLQEPKRTAAHQEHHRRAAPVHGHLPGENGLARRIVERVRRAGHDFFVAGRFVSTATGKSARACATGMRALSGEQIWPVKMFLNGHDESFSTRTCVSSQTDESTGVGGSDEPAGSGVNSATRRGARTIAVSASAPEGGSHCRAKAQRCLAFAPSTSSETYAPRWNNSECCRRKWRTRQVVNSLRRGSRTFWASCRDRASSDRSLRPASL